jgi:phosphoribosyl 1,2-cyclic phosphodiesterase
VAVKFWGTRGSIPAPGRETVVYGGNTACVSIETDDHFIILDAGSGIRMLGNAQRAAGHSTGRTLHLFISHTHWDHIQGLPFFASAFVKGNAIRVYGPKLFHVSLEQLFSTQMQHFYFPIRMNMLGSDITFRELAIGDYPGLLTGIDVETCVTNHPVVDMAYKFTIGGRRLVYLTDNELYNEDYFQRVLQTGRSHIMATGRRVMARLRDDLRGFIAGADLLITDAFFTRAEYRKFGLGWGHSTYEDVFDLAVEAGVRQLCFFHHDPNRTDAALTAIEKDYQRRARRERTLDAVFAAREGMTLTL